MKGNGRISWLSSILYLKYFLYNPAINLSKLNDLLLDVIFPTFLLLHSKLSLFNRFFRWKTDSFKIRFKITFPSMIYTPKKNKSLEIHYLPSKFTPDRHNPASSLNKSLSIKPQTLYFHFPSKTASFLQK